MNPNYIEIYKYYQGLDELNQFVFIDLINNLIKGIDSVKQLKEDFIKNNYEEHLEDIKDFIKEIGLSETDGFSVYKKIDYTANKDIANLIDIKTTSSISKLSLIRRAIILKLIKYDFIEDLNIGMDSIYSEKDMIKEKFIIIKEDGTKKLDFNQLKISQTNMKVGGETFDIKKENIGLLIYLTMVSQLKTYYGEDELNKELNMDESYKQIIFYKADKKILEKIVNKVINNGKNEVIEKYEFKNNKLFINGEEFKLIKSPTASNFLSLLSLYCNENNIKKITPIEFDKFYIKNRTSETKFKCNVNNIKNNYIKTIKKQIGKKYVNNDIIDFKENKIILK